MHRNLLITTFRVSGLNSHSDRGPRSNSWRSSLIQSGCASLQSLPLLCVFVCLCLCVCVCVCACVCVCVCCVCVRPGIAVCECFTAKCTSTLRVTARASLYVSLSPPPSLSVFLSLCRRCVSHSVPPATPSHSVFHPLHALLPYPFALLHIRSVSLSLFPSIGFAPSLGLVVNCPVNR